VQLHPVGLGQARLRPLVVGDGVAGLERLGGEGHVDHGVRYVVRGLLAWLVGGLVGWWNGWLVGWWNGWLMGVKSDEV
jgi:hypothetical protein